VTAPAHERGAWLLALAAVAVAVLVLVATPSPQRASEPVRWADLQPPPEAPLHPWRWIVIHHSGSANDDAEIIDRYHEKGRGWDGIGYHFVVGNGVRMPLGRIEATFRWRGQIHGAHAGAGRAQEPYNQDGIGICLVGDYRDQGPDPYLEQRAVELCARLIERIPTLNPDAILGHNQVPGKDTLCPGAKVDIARLRALVRAELARGATSPP
jgi:N-acetyl-anhydromuramyl-L-alanine amidase AmpD